MMMIQSNTTNETESTVEVFNFARDSGDEEVNIDMDDDFTEAAAAPPVFKRSFCGGNILTIGGIVLAVAIAFATGFASGNASNQAELVQLKAAASTSALYPSKSSKGPTAKSSKAHLGCDMMVGVHLGDSWHGISCDINAVTACAGDSPADACCYGVTMDWRATTGINLAAMLLPDVTGKGMVLTVQGLNGTGTIAGAITFGEGMITNRRISETASETWSTFASTNATNLYDKFASGALDVVLMKN